jgi:hypothetical protein
MRKSDDEVLLPVGTAAAAKADKQFKVSGIRQNLAGRKVGFFRTAGALRHGLQQTVDGIRGR